MVHQNHKKHQHGRTPQHHVEDWPFGERLYRKETRNPLRLYGYPDRKRRKEQRHWDRRNKKRWNPQIYKYRCCSFSFLPLGCLASLAAGFISLKVGIANKPDIGWVHYVLLILAFLCIVHGFLIPVMLYNDHRRYRKTTSKTVDQQRPPIIKLDVAGRLILWITFAIDAVLMAVLYAKIDIVFGGVIWSGRVSAVNAGKCSTGWNNATKWEGMQLVTVVSGVFLVIFQFLDACFGSCAGTHNRQKLRKLDGLAEGITEGIATSLYPPWYAPIMQSLHNDTPAEIQAQDAMYLCSPETSGDCSGCWDSCSGACGDCCSSCTACDCDCGGCGGCDCGGGGFDLAHQNHGGSKRKREARERKAEEEAVEAFNDVGRRSRRERAQRYYAVSSSDEDSV
ncbi:hypothetical protein T439DRAFT_382850 [Meredithblackwellia eburnea MCA 4105]